MKKNYKENRNGFPYQKYLKIFLLLSIWSVLFSCATKRDLVRINKESSSEIAQLRGEILAMLKDSDGDGIADYLDSEPNTPRGARVDASGNTLDSDGDGTPDHSDKCLFLPGPASTNGCPVEEVREDRTLRDPNRPDQFWPIPNPTYVEDISDGFIEKDDDLETVYGKIRKHLQEKGRQFNRIMFVPESGFVVFSNLERINDSGTRLDLPIEIERGGCGILNIFHCLYGRPSARYMFFGYVVNTRIGLTTTDDIQEYNEIMKVVNRGFINLDKSYVRDIYNNSISADEYTISLIVYEYETYPGQAPKLVSNTTVDYLKLLFK
ncbi:hypothetical protein LV85_03243 [Algoriphagus chordae]|uniref:Thrombospondin type 3 repeat-containing protein n=1 Tax=Algoriphagus chordae TaxID=237019 RepID=A0A2W7SEL1_9BACT|nr:hypothetical protein LV85_03243 [Algoriphagus chordae]